ncbi:MAG: GNAT family N-acetyltransferase [Akkermansia sp.]|nr:GNAT family N-acetyltransferase [Akkermansia sp.]
MISCERVESAAELKLSGLWQIYEDAFPREERRSWEQHCRAMLSEPGFYCMRLAQNGRSVGVLFYWQLGDFYFLEHLAVRAADRGLGIGHAALQWLQTLGKPIILEIEPPVDDISRRRLTFYRSLGFSEQAQEHVQAAFHADTAAVPMSLLSWPTVQSDATVASFELLLRNVVMKYVDACY